MDYQNKYLKYKEKYINLKKMLGGTDPELEKKLFSLMSDDELINTPDNFFEKLKEIYPSTKYDNTENKKYDNHIITYGEMEYEGMFKLIKYLNDNQSVMFDHFIDLGSGRGKLSLQLACLPYIKKSIGIEIVKKRHDDAENNKKKLNDYKKFTDKVLFINDDFNKVDLSNHIKGITLVWLSNLCFPQELTNKIFNKLLDILPPQSIIACSKQHLLNTKQLFRFPKLQVPMSWNNDATIFLYRIL